MLFKKKKDNTNKAAPVAKTVDGRPYSLMDGVPTLKDLIAPPSIDRSTPDHLVIGDRYMRSSILSGFPKRISVGWANRLYNYDGDLDMSIHINPTDERAATDELTDKITQFEAQLDIEAKGGSNRNITRLQNKIAELYREREKIEQNYVSMFGVQMITNLYSDSIENLNKESQMLESSIRGQKIKMTPLNLRQDQGYKSGLPFGKTWLPKNVRNFSSEGLTACFPFYNAEVSHRNGVLLGINEQTRTPIYIDFFNRRILDNGNICILGRAGAGKTFLVSLLIMRSALQGVRTVIIDPEAEYGSVTEDMGGTVIRIAPGSKTIPNPFDIEDEEEVDDDGIATGRRIVDIKGKVGDLLNLVGVMAGDLTQEQRSLVSFALANVYEEFGITTDHASLYSDDVVLNERGEFIHHGRKRRMPTFSDFHRKLVEVASIPGHEALSPVVNALAMFKRDGVYGMFDCETDESVANYKDAPVVCFDVKSLEEDILRPIGMYVAMSWAWEKFGKKNPEVKKRIICDEAWMLTNPNMTGYQYTASFLETVSRRSRKRNCSLLVATQGFSEFVSCLQGEAVLNNAVVKIFMKQSATDIDALQKKFKLSNGEYNYLLSLPKGHFLLKMDTESTTGFARAMPYEKLLIESHTIANNPENKS